MTPSIVSRVRISGQAKACTSGFGKARPEVSTTIWPGGAARGSGALMPPPLPSPACGGGSFDNSPPQAGKGRVGADVFQHQRQAGGDKHHAVGESGELLVEAAGFIAEPAAERGFRHHAE